MELWSVAGRGTAGEEDHEKAGSGGESGVRSPACGIRVNACTLNNVFSEKERRYGMKIRQRLLVGVLLGVGAVGQGQEVRIDSFSGNGLMTWQAPSNSDCTIEWASSLSSTAKWSRSWLELMNLGCTSGVTTCGVPMFYRVSSWTNGLFVRMPIGRTFVYAASNALAQTWTQEVFFAGMLTIPSMTNNYVALSSSDHYQGSPPAGSSENKTHLLRSTDKAMYGFESVGAEYVAWQNAPLGTTWTNGSEVRLIVTNETITVPAGTFTGCIKFQSTDTSAPPPFNTWYEWVKPGLFMVKWIDYYVDETNATPVVYQLQSWRDN